MEGPEHADCPPCQYSLGRAVAQRPWCLLTSFARYVYGYLYDNGKVRAGGPVTVERLFAEIEKYDPHERAETFEYLTRALHETRSLLGSEDVYLDK